MAPGIELPQRTSRGKRIQQVLEDEGDENFWNQEFFAEEAQDIDYQESDEEEDVPDSDFDVSEDGDDDEDVEDVKEKEKKKVLKPPGAAKRPRPAKPRSPKAQAADAAEDGEEGDEGEGGKARGPKESPVPLYYEAPTLRRSTINRVQDAERERQQQQATAPRRKTTAAAPAPMLTQAELLAEAAYTELDNLASLQLLMAQEEESKKRAMVVKKKYGGPSLKYKSRRVDEEALTTLELLNARQLRAWMRPRPAEPPVKPMCCVTSQAARYRDPKTGLYYASAAAFKQIRLSQGLLVGEPLLPQAPVQAPSMLSEDVAALLVDFLHERTTARGV